MATAVFRPNAHLAAPSMHMLPMMAGQTPVHLHHHLHHHHQQQQQQQHLIHTIQPQLQQQHQQPPLGKRAIAPASAQHPRTVTPLHPNNGQQQQRSHHSQPQPQSMLQPKTTKSTVSKLPFHPHPVAPYPLQPASVQRRNARERNRVKQVNNGFANLRQHIPSDVITALSDGTIGRGASKKLSKVDTLKLAVEYIRRLQDLIDETDADASSGSGGAGMQSSGSDVHSTSSNSSSSASESSYYSTSPPSSSALQMSTDQQSMIDSHRSTASPTPSYISDVSSATQAASASVASHQTAQPEYKYEPYDTYNAEDEELLDCITWWQQQ